jgi:hypothetical protein
MPHCTSHTELVHSLRQGRAVVCRLLEQHSLAPLALAQQNTTVCRTSLAVCVRARHQETAALVAILFNVSSHAWLHQGVTAVHDIVRLRPSAAAEGAEGSQDLPQSNKCHVHLMATICSVEASHCAVSMQMPIEAPVKVRKQHVQHVEYHRDMYGQARALPQPGDRVLDAQPAHRMDFWGADRDGDDIDAYSDGDFDAGAGPGFHVHTQRLHRTEDELRFMFSNSQCAGTVQPLWASQNKGVLLVSCPIHDPESGTVGMFAKEALHLPGRCVYRAVPQVQSRRVSVCKCSLRCMP